MTFQLLQNPTETILASDPYQATGSDQAEYEKWMQAIHGQDVILDDEIENDLQDMGL